MDPGGYTRGGSPGQMSSLAPSTGRLAPTAPLDSASRSQIPYMAPQPWARTMSQNTVLLIITCPFGGTSWSAPNCNSCSEWRWPFSSPCTSVPFLSCCAFSVRITVLPVSNFTFFLHLFFLITNESEVYLPQCFRTSLFNLSIILFCINMFHFNLLV
jgi:hypothetical protein